METLDGCKFMQRLEGDFILSESVSPRLRIEGRFKRFGHGTVQIGVAVQVRSQTLELMGRPAEGPAKSDTPFTPKLFLNGQAIESQSGGAGDLVFSRTSDNRININANGFLLACTVHEELGLVNCAYEAGPSFKNLLRGLLGNFNGVRCDSGFGLNADKDLRTEAGLRVSVQSSLFSDKSWAADDNFAASTVPLFDTPEERNQARDVCRQNLQPGTDAYQDCMYDISVTKAVRFAGAEKDGLADTLKQMTQNDPDWANTEGGEQPAGDDDEAAAPADEADDASDDLEEEDSDDDQEDEDVVADEDVDGVFDVEEDLDDEAEEDDQEDFA